MVFEYSTIEIFGRLILAVLLGLIIGAEREQKGKAAGFRTYGFVSLGAALFTVISSVGFSEFVGMPGFDPSRVVSQVVVGIGFLGAGIIFLKGDKVNGLTTAASLWVMAAIGAATGIGLYSIAIFTTVVAYLMLRFLSKIEQDVLHSNQKNLYEDLNNRH